MTQFYTYRGLGLRTAGLPIRTLLTAFLLMAGISVAVGAVNYQLRTGLSAAGSRAWYRGGLRAEGQAAVETSEPSELEAKSVLELMDASHPHLFNQAFLFFVLGHILALCSLRPGLKITVYLGGFGGVLVDTASPWLIRFVDPGFAWLQLVGQTVMALAFAALLLLPLREMWGREGRAARRRIPADARAP